MLARNVTPIVASLAIAAALAAGGCSADDPMNPSFPLSVADARDEWRVMMENPRPFARPLVILGGIYDPGFVAPATARDLRKITTEDARIVTVSFLMTADFDACRARAIRAVDAAWPNDDPDATVEVDVLAISMGGLVARYAARPTPDAPRRLNVRRLFTISTPHLGARMASLPTLDARVLSMRGDSGFLDALNGEHRAGDPEIVPYTRLGDAIVGPERSAPPGRTAWWVANMPFAFAHLNASHDPRILVDIARRLRGESPYTREPAAPLPGAATAAQP